MKFATVFFISYQLIFTISFAQKKSAYPKDKDLTAYLFTYFTGNKVEDESIHFAVSTDGLSFFALNNNEPVIDSREISSTGGVRDPHIVRGVDGKTFYMVVTDMTSSKGWDSNRAMVLLRSSDLIGWTSNVINIQNRFPGNDSLLRVWAPQTIYDPEVNKYMVYWSMKHGKNGQDIIYYSYANKDFTDLETEPKQLFFPSNGKSCIDGDIILKDGVYHLFYKTEGHGDGIKLATAESLTSGKWIEREGYIQQTEDAVEGSSIYKLMSTGEYVLMYDVYKAKRYEFCKSKTLDSFTRFDSITMDFKPRHGTVVNITNEELKRLLSKWGTPNGFRK